MLPRHYHNPPTPVSPRLQCPVCQKSVYSKAGIHPQCAIKIADPPRPDAEAEVVPDPSAAAPA